LEATNAENIALTLPFTYEQLENAAKPYTNFDPRLIELHKKFSYDLTTHVNPYTKLAYKDDPAVVLMEFANENDLFTQKVTLESQVRALATDHFHTHRDKRPKPPKQGKAKWI